MVAANFLKDNNAAKKFPDDIIAFFTDAAAAGYAKEGLKLLKNSACALYMEPLIVALRLQCPAGSGGSGKRCPGTNRRKSTKFESPRRGRATLHLREGPPLYLNLLCLISGK
ncbi:MAG TPA: hypothetical protein VK186_27420 [Candidatus Deferrimicrobium sp.]|nr:hypothetical protein [Candidatus Deferrimicrobium sp.]